MDLGLSNKKALIAGSTSGLGFAVANQLSNEGATVCLNGRDADKLKKALGGLQKPNKAFGLAVNITDADNCKTLVSYGAERMGGIDMLITNCGGPPPGSFESIHTSQWEDAINQSLMSHIYLIRYALPFLKESTAPSILTVTSFTVRQPLDNLILSNSVRAATVGLTKTLSKEFGQYGIRVNSILPGWTFTQRVEQLIDDRVKRNHSTSKEELSKITDRIPLSRMASPEEFGRCAAFLVSPAASYINGVMLNVDGGLYDGLL